MSMKPRRKPREEVEIPTASMGDVAFNLISFFLVCSIAMRDAGIKIEAPEVDELKSMQKPPSLMVTMDEAAQLSFQGVPIAVESLSDAIEEVLDTRAEGEAREVLFKCDRNLDRNEFEPAIAAIAESGAVLVMAGDDPKPARR